jgi:PKD repeat protein
VKTTMIKSALLLIISLFANSLLYEAFSQTATLNNDCATATVDYPAAPTPGSWSCDDPGVTFANENSPTTTAFNIPFGVTINFTWSGDGTTIPMDGFDEQLADAGDDIFLCDEAVNETQLQAILPGGTTGEWFRDQGSGTWADNTDPETMITGLNRGLSIYRWVVTDLASGCSGEDQVNIFFMPVTADAGSLDVIPICDDTYELSANDPSGQFIEPDIVATGYWEQIPPTAYEIIANSNSYVTTVSNLDWDDNRFRWTVTNGYCSASDDVIVRNNLPATPDAKNDTVICSTEYYLEAEPATRGVGEWEVIPVAGGGTIVTPSDNNSQVVDLDYYIQPGVFDYWTTVETVNTFRWTITFTDVDGNECSLSDDVDVINLLPLPADAGEDQRVCGTTANLNAECLGSGSMEHLWYQDGGDPDGPFVPGGSTVEFYHPNRDPQQVDNTEFNTHVEGLQTGITSFIWFKRNELDYHGDYYNNDYSVTCVDTDTMQIESVIGAIDINAGQNGTICADTITLQATPNTGGALEGHWEVIAGTGVFTNSTNAETFVSGLDLTTNVLRWTIYDNDQLCYYTDDVYYTNALPSGKDVGDDVVTCDDYARITANRPIRGTGVWSFSGWPSGYNPLDPGSISSTSCQSDECNTYIYNLTPGTYDMTWTVTNEYTGPETPPGTCQIDTTMHVYMMGVTANPGVGQAVCDDSTQLNALLPVGMIGTWQSMDITVSFDDGSIATMTNDPSPSVYNLKRGSNYFRWTIDNGVCDDWAEVVVYNDLPSDAVINNPVGTGVITECSGIIDISAQPIDGDDFGEWTESSVLGVDFSSSSAINTTVSGVPEQQSALITWTVTHTGVHPDIGIASKVCSLDDEIYLLNNSITANAMNVEPTICGDAGGFAETSITATMTEPLATGIWTKALGDPSIIVDDNSTTTLVTNMDEGTHYFTWNVSITQNGVTCEDEDVAIVNVEVPYPATAFVLDESSNPWKTLEVCGDEVTLQADPPPSVEAGIGVWSKEDPGVDVIVDPTNYETTVLGLSAVLNERHYTWTITTEHGCESSETVTVLSHGVEANAHVGTDMDVFICESEYELTGNDLNWYNSQPSYPVTAIGTWSGPGGAIVIDNSASNVTMVSGLPAGGVQNTFVWTVAKDGCVASDIVNIYNQAFTISAGGPYESCDETITMNAENPGSGYGVWELAGASGEIVSPSNNTTEIINITTPGDNYFKWTVYRNGCEAEDIATVTNNTVVADAGTYPPLCEDSVRLSAGIMPTGASGIWTVEAGAPEIEIENSTERITWARNLAFGSSTFRWTVSKSNCDDFDIVEINNMEVIAKADDVHACELPVRLSGNNPADFGGTGLWEDPSGTITFVDDPALYNARIDNVPNDGIIVLEWTVSNSQCSDNTEVVVENNSFEISAGVNDEVCDDDADLSAEDRGTGYWEVRSGTGVFDNSTSPVTTIQNLEYGDNLLRWTVSDNGCTAYDEVVIRNNKMNVSAGPDDVTCDNFYYLVGTPLSPTATGHWSGGGNVVIEDPGASSTLVENLSNGINTFTWSITDNECTSSADVVITSNFFKANAGSDQFPVTSSTTMNADLPGGATGVWITYSGSGNPVDNTDPGTVMNNLGYGLNEFIWRVTWNTCPVQDTVAIIYNPLVAEAGAGGPICFDYAFMDGNDPSIYGGTGIWTVIEGEGEFIDAMNPKTQVVNMKRGKNVYRWTVTINGASTYDEVTFYNNRFTLNAGLDQDVCNDNTQLHGDVATNGIGVWTIGDIGNGTFNTPSTNDALVTDLLEGANEFIWTVDKTGVGGCIESDTVVVYFNIPPTAAFMTNISEGCSPIDVEYTNTSSGGETYYWDFGSEERTDTALEIFTKTYEALYHNDSVYTTTLIAYSSAGCTDTVSKEIKVLKIPKVEFDAYPVVQIYPDATVNFQNLSGETYDKYYWDYGDGSNQIDQEFVPVDDHKYAAWGKYLITLQAEAGECEGLSSQWVEILAPQPKDNGGSHLGGCNPFGVNFDANVAYADTFLWKFGDFDASSNEENPSYIYDRPGRYYVELYVGGPGTDGELLPDPIRIDTIDVYPTPEADFVIIPDTVLLPNQAVHCDNFTTNGDYFEWDFGDDLPVSTDANPLHYYTKAGIYNISLKVYTENECFDDTIVNEAVVVLDPGFVRLPTAFSPSPSGPSDGRWARKDRTNDVFHAVYRGVKEFKLEIFNRWGEKIFESNDPAIGWNGYVDGKMASQDVYVWKVSGKYINGVLFKNSGDVTLLR